MKKLTRREESLCQAMLTCDDKTQALILSEYKTDKMKPATIHQEACRKFKKPHIAARMAELLEARNKRNNIDADYVLKRLVEIDELDILDIFDDVMNLKPLSQWPAKWRRSLSALDIQEMKMGKDDDDPITFIKRIKLPDKVKNLELIGKHVDVQAWSDKTIDVNVNVTHRLSDVARRIANERVVSEQ